jgi:hypothetical protein
MDIGLEVSTAAARTGGDHNAWTKGVWRKAGAAAAPGPPGIGDGLAPGAPGPGTRLG